MKMTPRSCGAVGILTLLPIVACGTEELTSPIASLASAPDVKATVDLGPNSQTATPGKDFIDAAGRRWATSGKVQLRPGAVSKPLRDKNSTRATKSLAEMSRDELAQNLRGVRLIGDYEYRLAQPDYVTADKIIALKGRPAPSTPANLGAIDVTGVTPQDVQLPDGRVQVIDSSHVPGRRWGIMNPQYCTMTMIGPSTAMTAAHCVYLWISYLNGYWMPISEIVLGRNNYSGTVTTPFGTHTVDTVTIPEGYSVWGLDAYDFAVLEFSPTSYPGNTVGWEGTADLTFFPTPSPTQYEIGYSGDKPPSSQWVRSGSYLGLDTNNSHYWHYIDDFGGDSGACLYQIPQHQCTAINTHTSCTGSWVNGVCVNGTWWNESRAWDSVTTSFFSTYGNWP